MGAFVASALLAVRFSINFRLMTVQKRAVLSGFILIDTFQNMSSSLQHVPQCVIVFSSNVGQTT